MKYIFIVAVVTIAFTLFQCVQPKKSKSSTNEVPVATAHAWQDSLAQSQFSIYENFDGQYLFLSDVEKKITQQDKYMRLFLGKSGDDYRLISVVCQGTLTAGNFNNDYNTLEYFNGAGWTSTVFDSLEIWVDNFKYALPSDLPSLPYAMVIPTVDFTGIKPYIQNDKVYISFGLDGNVVEMLLGSEDNSDGQTGSPNERYYNSLLGCPVYCAGNDPT